MESTCKIEIGTTGTTGTSGTSGTTGTIGTNTIEEIEYSYERLNFIREQIEMMAKSSQIEILRMLQENSNVVLSENNYGTFVNLSDLSPVMISRMETYIHYWKDQENMLSNMETKKEAYKSNFFDMESI